MDTHLIVALGDRDGEKQEWNEKVRRRITYAVQCASRLHGARFGIMSGSHGRQEMVACYKALGVEPEQLVFPEGKQQPVTSTLEELSAAFSAADRLKAVLVLVTSMHHLPRVLLLCRYCLRASFVSRRYHDQVQILAARPLREELNTDEIVDAVLEVPRLALAPIVCARRSHTDA